MFFYFIFFIFCISVVKIPRVKSYEFFLKKSWIVITHKRLMQQNCIVSLQSNRELLKRFCPSLSSAKVDFSVNRVLMKLFRSSNIEIIAECRNHFGVELPSVQLAKRFKKFSDKICIMIAQHLYMILVKT